MQNGSRVDSLFMCGIAQVIGTRSGHFGMWTRHRRLRLHLHLHLHLHHATAVGLHQAVALTMARFASTNVVQERTQKSLCEH